MMARYRPIFEAERAPCGVAGGLTWHYHSYVFCYPAPDISDVFVARARPWKLVLWEPIKTLAPSPARCSAYCCYANTVIFYARPYVKREWQQRYWSNGKLQACSPSFEKYDQVDTRFHWNDIVTFEGQHFELGGGPVEWRRKRWWMCRGARRVQQARAA